MSGKQIGFYLERTTRKVKLAFTQAFIEENIDLTPEQWVLLDHLLTANGVSQADLAGKSYKNAPTVSRIIDVLERKGFVERQRFENDRRRYKIFLTKEGRAIGEKALPVAIKLRAQGWDHLTDADYDHFIRIVESVFKNFE